MIWNIYRAPVANWCNQCSRLVEKRQTEIQKQQSERRHRQLEQRIQMASKNPGKGGRVKNPKPQKKDEENPEDLETLMEEMDKPKCKTVLYTRLSTGQWVTKGMDRQAQLEGRTKRVEEAAAKAQPEDDYNDDNEEETEKDQLECEMRELAEQLKKAEK